LPVPSPLQVGRNDSDRLQQYKYAVKTVMDGRYLGYGNTEQEALSDAYSAYPEYWNDMNDVEAPKYAQWVLPGGDNYTEMLLTLPGNADIQTREQFTIYDEAGEAITQGMWPPSSRTQERINANPQWRVERKTVLDRNDARRKGVYQSAHWDETNVLAHIRMNDRKDADGNNVLFIEELQSDWAQEGRKQGFAGSLQAGYSAVEALNAVPSAPFMARTKDWVALGVKRVMLLAVQGGYDKVAFVNGQQSAERYNLAKQIDKVEYTEGGALYAWDKSGNEVMRKKMPESEVEDHIGKDLAEKLLTAEKGKFNSRTLTGAELEVGGEGMKSFYDRIVPQVVNDVIKKLGGRMESVSIETADKYEAMKTARAKSGLTDNQWNNLSTSEQAALIPSTATTQPGFTVTPEMREKLQGEGLPLFSTKRRLAPNGKPSNLTEEQWLQVRTPEFKAWFGDWEKHAQAENPVGSLWSDPEVSKAVDENGEPLVLYHGTTDGGFTIFDASGRKAKVQGATFFTPNKAMAQSYSGSGKEVSLRRLETDEDLSANNFEIKENRGLFELYRYGNLVDRFDTRQDAVDSVNSFRTSGLYPVFLNIRDPDEADFEGANWDGGRYGQYVVENEEGEPVYDANGRAYFEDKADAEELAENVGGEVNPAPDHYDSTDGVVREAQRLKNDGAIIRNVTDMGPRLSPYAGEATDVFVTFKPEQVKSATQNVGTFDATNPDIRYSNRRAFGTLTAEQEAALNKVGGLKVNATIRERFMDLKNSFQKSWQQGIFDQFAPLRELSQEAYMKARLSKGSDGTLEATMLYGKPYMNKDGVPDVNINDKGFAKTLASLKGEQDRFMWWIAAQRAGMLKMQGLENLFDYGDISALLDLNQGTFADGTPRAPVYAKAMKEMNEFNDAVLKVAVDSGLVDPKAQAMFKDMPYVPFYRVMEGGKMTGAKFSSGLVNQVAWKKLKGGTQKLNSDLLANTLLNWSHLFTAAANNRAAVASLQAAAKAEIAYEVPAGTKDSVKVMVGGEAYHYVISDPHLMSAVSALEYVSPDFFKPFSMFKRWLTVAVTANPSFKIKNLIRDSLSAISQSDLSGNPLANVAQGLKATSKEGQTYASMLAGGGVIRFGSMVEGDRSHQAKALIEREGGVLLDKKGWEKLSSQMMSVLHAYNELGDRMENVNRAALYEQLIKKGHSSAEANFMARDLMDFSMSGKWPVVRFLTQTVPFMNARLQGLYKLGRSAKENPARFGYTVGAVALASIALMLAYEDDEDWKKRPDWDRDANWWFKIGGTAFRIPKPFEIGAIGTLAERTWEMFFNKEMTGKRYRERISNMIFDTFAMDPTPQIVKPLLDVYSNKAGFTGRPIESMGMQKLRPEDRVSTSTSQVAKFLGQLGLPDPAQLAKGEYRALSPVQADYLLRGYFGWLGTSAVTAIDYAIRPMTGQGERPDMRLKDVFLVGSFVESLPSGSSRYVDQMYQQANEIEQAYSSWRDAQKRGDYAAAKDIFEEEKEKIVKYKQVEKVKDRVIDINARIKQIQSSTSLSGDTKRRMIDQLELQKDQAARAFKVGG